MGDAVPVVNLFSILYSSCHTYPQALQEYHTSDKVLARGFTRALAQRGQRFDEWRGTPRISPQQLISPAFW